MQCDSKIAFRNIAFISPSQCVPPIRRLTLLRSNKLMEKILITWDWAEAFVALSLVAKPAIDEAVLRKLGDSARHNGDMLLGLLTDAQLVDSARHRRWASSLVKMAVETPGNAEVIKGWIAKWEPLADKAIDAYCNALAGQQMPLALVALTESLCRGPELVHSPFDQLELATSTAAGIAFVWKRNSRTQCRTQDRILSTLIKLGLISNTLIFRTGTVLYWSGN